MGNDFAPAIILAAVVILFVIIMRYTRFGRYVYAIGSNGDSARLAAVSYTHLLRISPQPEQFQGLKKYAQELTRDGKNVP